MIAELRQTSPHLLRASDVMVEKYEEDLDMMQDRLIDMHHEAQAKHDLLSKIRSGCRTLPHRWARQMVGLKTVDAAEAALEEGLRELEEILNSEPAGREPSQSTQ